MVGLRHTTAFHFDVDANGNPLSAQERERLLRPYLPDSLPNQSPVRRPAKTSAKHRSSQSLRQFVDLSLHVLLYNLIQFLFSVYVRFRIAYNGVRDRIYSILYYHHRAPEYIQKDVQRLSKLPQHLSIILSLDESDVAGLESLINDVCEVAAWSACAGIPMLSIYEQSGILKSSLPHLHRRISRTLTAYYGNAAPSKPTISLRAPHMQSFSPPSTPTPDDASAAKAPQPHLSILLLSASDGRRTIVDLTKTLAEMSQKSKLAPEDISVELIDAEISESVMGEPDLLMLFGDSVVLKGYPPWQIRLTEIL